MGVTITTIQGDYGVDINFTLQDANNNPINLGGVTSMLFRTQRVGRFALNSSGAMVIDNAIAGTCHYTIQQGDFNNAGIYNAQIRINFSGEVMTFDNLFVDVLPVVPF